VEWKERVVRIFPFWFNVTPHVTTTCRTPWAVNGGSGNILGVPPHDTRMANLPLEASLPDNIITAVVREVSF
jgi:hypothetical protein